jgi:hypothetical protein
VRLHQFEEAADGAEVALVLAEQRLHRAFRPGIDVMIL